MSCDIVAGQGLRTVNIHVLPAEFRALESHVQHIFANLRQDRIVRQACAARTGTILGTMRQANDRLLPSCPACRRRAMPAGALSLWTRR
jgi:hypothetical protein